MKKLAIVTSHPIQYNAPWFQLLAVRQKIDLKVFYTWSQAITQVKDKSFGQTIQWDIPLLDGYEFEVLENVSKNPGTHHFMGIDCPDLIGKLKAFQPDAILIFGWNFKCNLKVMRYFKGKVPILFRGDSTLLNESLNIKTLIRRFVLSWVYCYVDKAFYVGSANKAYFLKHSLKGAQLVYAPHAIDNDRFTDSDQKEYQIKADKWRHELGIEPDDLVILFAGKLENVKQPFLLLESVAQVNQYLEKPLRLVLVGNGPLESQLKERAKDHNFVTFIPFQNQSVMPVVYRLGDVYCLASISETWGLAVNEAMASARPVIVSDKVGCAEDLVNASTGFVFPFDEPDALINLLIRLKKEQIKEMGNNAENFIRDWSFERLVKSFEEALG